MTNFLENEKYEPQPKLHDDQGRKSTSGTAMVTDMKLKPLHLKILLS